MIIISKLSHIHNFAWKKYIFVLYIYFKINKIVKLGYQYSVVNINDNLTIENWQVDNDNGQHSTDAQQSATVWQSFGNSQQMVSNHYFFLNIDSIGILVRYYKI